MEKEKTEKNGHYCDEDQLAKASELIKEWKRQKESGILLKNTSMEIIMKASGIILHRLNFIMGLEEILNQEKNNLPKEREQLHRIIANETWIFGEEYNLTNYNKSLTTVLKNHLAKVRDDIEVYDPVLRLDGRKGFVDLVLGRTISTFEYLVIELKRPMYPINTKALNQINSYALAIANHKKFREGNPKWTFLAISNDTEDDIKLMAQQNNRPFGLVYDYNPKHNITVWVKTWSQVIYECKARLKFFREELNYEVDGDSALAYLRKTYAKYLPGCLDGKES